jgi:hypothetical protein
MALAAFSNGNKLKDGFPHTPKAPLRTPLAWE